MVILRGWRGSTAYRNRKIAKKQQNRPRRDGMLEAERGPSFCVVVTELAVPKRKGLIRQDKINNVICLFLDDYYIHLYSKCSKHKLLNRFIVIFFRIFRSLKYLDLSTRTHILYQHIQEEIQ